MLIILQISLQNINSPATYRMRGQIHSLSLLILPGRRFESSLKKSRLRITEILDSNAVSMECF